MKDIARNINNFVKCSELVREANPLYASKS